MTSIENDKSSRYNVGGTTELSAGFLKWWEKNNYKKDPSDIIYKMEAKYENRPDLLSYLFYNDVSLWWLICQYNDILNPLEELKEGKMLFIPSLNRIKLSSIKSGIIKT
jgi:hypothetical protein